jgi:hypothetical protein
VDIDMRGILVRGTRTVKYFGSECDGHHRSHISALRRVTPRFDTVGTPRGERGSDCLIAERAKISPSTPLWRFFDGSTVFEFIERSKGSVNPPLQESGDAR